MALSREFPRTEIDDQVYRASFGSVTRNPYMSSTKSWSSPQSNSSLSQHFKLTTYGPEALQTFLRHELEERDRLRSAIQSDPATFKQEALHSRAWELVNVGEQDCQNHSHSENPFRLKKQSRYSLRSGKERKLTLKSEDTDEDDPTFLRMRQVRSRAQSTNSLQPSTRILRSQRVSKSLPSTSEVADLDSLRFSTRLRNKQLQTASNALADFETESPPPGTFSRRMKARPHLDPVNATQPSIETLLDGQQIAQKWPSSDITADEDQGLLNTKLKRSLPALSKYDSDIEHSLFMLQENDEDSSVMDPVLSLPSELGSLPKRRSLSFQVYARNKRGLRRRSKYKQDNLLDSAKSQPTSDYEEYVSSRKTSDVEKELCDHFLAFPHLKLSVSAMKHHFMQYRAIQSHSSPPSTSQAIDSNGADVPPTQGDIAHSPLSGNVTSAPVGTVFTNTRPRQRMGHDTFLTASSEDELADTSKYGSLSSFQEQHQLHEASILCEDRRAEADESNNIPKALVPFDFAVIVPEKLPRDLSRAKANRTSIWLSQGLDETGKPDFSQQHKWHGGLYTMDALDPTKDNILRAPDDYGQFPRKWEVRDLPISPHDPPFCPPVAVMRNSLPLEIWECGVLRYLSSTDIRNLRLTSNTLSEDLAPYMVRNVVTKFGRSMFDVSDGANWDTEKGGPAIGTSMFEKFGPDINKFGISFDYDELGLGHARPKQTEQLIKAWFGDYYWPLKEHPFFPPLKEIDGLLDNQRPLMREALKKLTKCKELAISIDSGHGWLEGPDLSDLALLNLRANGGTKVFGKKFDAEDKWHAFGVREIFKWAQQNSINESLKMLDGVPGAKEERARLRRIVVRDYDSYRIQAQQTGFERYAHTGGRGTPQSGPANPPPAAPFQPAPFHPQPQANMLQTHTNVFPLHSYTPAGSPSHAASNNHPMSIGSIVGQHKKDTDLCHTSKPRPILPQWPLIFNGYNVAAVVSGDLHHIQDNLAKPNHYPLLPAWLDEAQVQWLMETLWIQRSFLTAYIDAIIMNRNVLKEVHSLHFPTLSSGLLPQLAQDGFWSALPGLRSITILVKPDWRNEHLPGDKSSQKSPSIYPYKASVRLAELLRDHISKLEGLYSLTVGFASGGEHQPGIYGRNQHIPPAPITTDPLFWVSDHVSGPSMDHMFSLNHIRKLTFQNCWFSPSMLENFMRMSRDTSLHHLILDSVSLTGLHGHRNNETGELQTVLHHLTCKHHPAEWLHETIPRCASWVKVLNNMTPGKTFMDLKYEAGLIESLPEQRFRGNVQTITLKSCGYVRLQGVSRTAFNQIDLVGQNQDWHAMDHGLHARTRTFYMRRAPSDSVYVGMWNNRLEVREENGEENDQDTGRPHIMLSSKESVLDKQNTLLGTLTQCVHPIEKRILEHAWGMRFGWGDVMERWAAVEDGFFEGGTGRFSGEIRKDN